MLDLSLEKYVEAYQRDYDEWNGDAQTVLNYQILPY